MAFFLLFIALIVRTPEAPWETPVFLITSILTTLILIDSFRTLGKNNPVPRRVTWITLVFILTTSQTFLVAKALQLCAYEVFHIPNSSMEPTLLGNVSVQHRLENCPFRSLHANSSGDRILVSKLAYVGSPIERFDVVVFRFPLLETKNFVKRVVGMPGEQIQIHQGDLYSRARGESQFRIVRKPLPTQDAIWIPVEEGVNPLSDSSALREKWDLAAGEPGGYAIDHERLEIISSFETSFRLRSVILDNAGQEVDDARLSFMFDLTEARAEVFAERVNRYGRFGARLTAGGNGVLEVEVQKGKWTIPLSYAPLKPGQPSTFDLLVFDGTAYVRLNGRILARENFIEVLEDTQTNRRQHPELSFGMKGGRGHISRLVVGRDIQYRGRNGDLALREDTPVAIPEGSYLVLGDNIANSHDSRAWVKRTFHLKDGRTIVCEEQQIVRSYSSEFLMTLKDKYKLPRTPDFAIDGDEHGNEVALFDSDIDKQDPPEPFRFIERRFVTGRVQKVWWPLSRARAVR